MNLFNKYKKEKEVCDFFIKNFLKEGEYIQSTEDREIDCEIKLSSDKTEKTQIISCDQEVLKIIAKSTKYPGEVFDINRKADLSIKNAIQKKSNHYEKELLKNIILLVYSENISINSDFLLKETQDVCKNSDYKSIFFIKLPDNKEKTTYPKNIGDIIKLK